MRGIRRVVLLWAALYCVPSTYGSVLRVPGDYPSIQLAMNAAASGDSVAVGPGTYTNCDSGPCTGSVVLMKSGVDLVSDAGPEMTVLRVDTPGGGISVVRGVGINQVLLSGFTITGSASQYGGAAFLGCSGVEIDSCWFVDLNSGLPSGGGVFTNGTHVTVRNCRFVRCAAVDASGGFEAIDGNVVLDACLFEECAMGAAQLLGHSGLSAIVRDCVFTRNLGNTPLAILSMTNAEVARCAFVANTSPQNGAALVINAGNGGQSGNTILKQSLFVANVSSGISLAPVSWKSSGEIRGNTFYGNAGTSTGFTAAVLDIAEMGTTTAVMNNIFASNTSGVAYRASFIPPQASCNLFWSNPQGDYAGFYVPSSTDLFVDPLFCEPKTLDFSLESGSPCLPKNSGVCGLIGALDEGCGTVSIDPTSWGRLKATYR